MKEYNYNKEIKILLTQVMDALGDLIIRRTHETTGALGDYIQVNLRYSPKTRMLHDIVNKNQHITLPIIAVSLGPITYDSSRTFNKIEGFYLNELHDSNIRHLYQPLPVNVVMNVSVIARFQNDIDQIITNLFANFHPYIIISYTHPEVNQEVRCMVEWSGNINPTYPVDLGETQDYRIIADSSFTVRGWIYRNTNNHSGKIYTIPVTFQSVSAIEDYDYMKRLETQYNTDSFTISARPFVSTATPYLYFHDLTGQRVDVFGDMFQYVSSVYLSGVNGVYPSSTEYASFSSISSLSALYPPFTAFKIDSFDIANEHSLSFTLPSATTGGSVDIILESEAGYGKLTVDSTRLGDYQYPWNTGIILS